jgi:hypothetical protein
MTDCIRSPSSFDFAGDLTGQARDAAPGLQGQGPPAERQAHGTQDSLRKRLGGKRADCGHISLWRPVERRTPCRHPASCEPGEWPANPSWAICATWWPAPCRGDVGGDDGNDGVCVLSHSQGGSAGERLHGGQRIRQIGLAADANWTQPARAQSGDELTVSRIDHIAKGIDDDHRTNNHATNADGNRSETRLHSQGDAEELAHRSAGSGADIALAYRPRGGGDTGGISHGCVRPHILATKVEIENYGRGDNGHGGCSGLESDLTLGEYRMTPEAHRAKAEPPASTTACTRLTRFVGLSRSVSRCRVRHHGRRRQQPPLATEYDGAAGDASASWACQAPRRAHP